MIELHSIGLRNIPSLQVNGNLPPRMEVIDAELPVAMHVAGRQGGSLNLSCEFGGDTGELIFLVVTALKEAVGMVSCTPLFRH